MIRSLFVSMTEHIIKETASFDRCQHQRDKLRPTTYEAGSPLSYQQERPAWNRCRVSEPRNRSRCGIEASLVATHAQLPALSLELFGKYRTHGGWVACTPLSFPIIAMHTNCSLGKAILTESHDHRNGRAVRFPKITNAMMAKAEIAGTHQASKSSDQSVNVLALSLRPRRSTMVGFGTSREAHDRRQTNGEHYTLFPFCSTPSGRIKFPPSLVLIIRLTVNTVLRMRWRGFCSVSGRDERKAGG